MAAKLTSVAVKNHRAGKARREIPDGGCPGLFLVIQPSGVKSFAMRFKRPDGKSGKLTLGRFDPSEDTDVDPEIGHPLTLAAARRLAAEVQRKRRMGRDVVADYRAKKERDEFEREMRAASAFGKAAEEFINKHAKRKTRRWQATARMLGLKPTPEGFDTIRGGLAYRWRERTVGEIDGADIIAVVKETRHSGVPGLERRVSGQTDATARLMRAALSKMFSWLAAEGHVATNPCRGVAPVEPAAARDRVLTNAEIAKFWKATEGMRFGGLLRLLLLTGCRVGEVAGMRRSELSDDGQTWTIPGKRTKNGNAHVVPLSPMAQDLIPEGDGDLVFTTTGDTPVSGWSKIKRRLDEEMKIPPWRLHDLRRTCATGMAEIGIAPHIVEACLNHVSGAKAGVAGIYNRALYAAEKKAALERWAEHVEGVASGRRAKVVPLRKGTPQ